MRKIADGGSVKIKIDGDNKDFDKSIKDTEKTISSEMSRIGNSINDMAGKVGIGFTAITAAAVMLEQGTRETREEMTKLKTAFEGAGKTATQATDIYTDFYGILGEEDQSVEAVSHLAELTNNQEELSQWTNISAGVLTKFGDSLPLEGLTEASNETAKVGKVTGSLADALNWAGKSEDAFNAELAELNSEQERASYITKTLSGIYGDLGDTYRQNNKTVIESREAEMELSLATAELGEAVAPLISEFTEIAADIIPMFTDVLVNNKDAVLATATALLAGVGAVKTYTAITTGIKVATDLWTGAQWLLNTAMNANPVAFVTTSVIALTTGIVTLIGAFADAPEPVKEANKALEDSRKAMDDMKKSTDEETASLEVNTRLAQKLVDKLDELEKSGLDTAEATAEYKITVDKLNKAMPELNLKIDKQTGLIEQNTNSIRTQIDTMKEQAKAAIYYDDVVEATQLLAEAEVELEKTQRERLGLDSEVEAAKLRMAEIDEIASEASVEERENMKALSEEREKLNTLIVNSASELSALTEAEQINQQAVGEATAGLVEVENQYNEYNTALEKNQALQASSSEQNEVYLTKLDSLKQRMESLNQAYTDSYNSAYSALSGTATGFVNLSDVSEISTSTILGNLQSQIDFMANYGNNFETVMTRAGNSMPEHFVAKLQDGSQESAAILQSMATATDDDFQAIVDSMGKVEEGKVNASHQMAETSTNFTENLDAMKNEYSLLLDELDQFEQANTSAGHTMDGFIEGANAKKTEVNTAFENLLNIAEGALKDTSGFTTEGNNAGQGYVNGTKAKLNDAYWAGRALAAETQRGIAEGQDSHSPAKEMIKLGGDGGDGYAIGIEDKEKEVKTAATSLADTAVQGFTVSDKSMDLLRETSRKLNFNVDYQLSKSTKGDISQTNTVAIRDERDIYLDSEKVGRFLSPSINRNLSDYENYERLGGV